MESVNCGICKEPVEGDCLTSNGQNFHSECMNCSDCGIPLRGRYYSFKDQFICEKDYKVVLWRIYLCGAFKMFSMSEKWKELSWLWWIDKRPILYCQQWKGYLWKRLQGKQKCYTLYSKICKQRRRRSWGWSNWLQSNILLEATWQMQQMQ